MDPNSQHQLWSRWEFLIHPGGAKRPPYCDVKHNAAKYARLKFGSTGAMNVREEFNRQTRKPEWRIIIRAEGHPVHEPAYVAWMVEEWAKFAYLGFGVGTSIDLVNARLEAGDAQNGKPRDQLIILDGSLMPKLKEEQEL